MGSNEQNKGEASPHAAGHGGAATAKAVPSAVTFHTAGTTPPSPTLLPCPFCGSEPCAVGESVTLITEERLEGYGVYCDSCGALGLDSDLWNRRAPVESMPESFHEAVHATSNPAPAEPGSKFCGAAFFDGKTEKSCARSPNHGGEHSPYMDSQRVPPEPAPCAHVTVERYESEEWIQGNHLTLPRWRCVKCPMEFVASEWVVEPAVTDKAMRCIRELCTALNAILECEDTELDSCDRAQGRRAADYAEKAFLGGLAPAPAEPDWEPENHEAGEFSHGINQPVHARAAESGDFPEEAWKAWIHHKAVERASPTSGSWVEDAARWAWKKAREGEAPTYDAYLGMMIVERDAALKDLAAARERVKELEVAEEAVSRRWTRPAVVSEQPQPKG